MNNAALAARKLTGAGRVALLDLDYHHGNGTQDIFYDDDSVFYISLHSDPQFAYPYFSGQREETGTGPGLGFTKNLPYSMETSSIEFLSLFNNSLEAISSYRPDFLVVSMGFDTHLNDPVGRGMLSEQNFFELGEYLPQLNLPLIIILEGGYSLEDLPESVLQFVNGLNI